MNMVFTMGFRVQIFGRRCALEPSFFFVKRQYTKQLTDKQGEQFLAVSNDQKHDTIVISNPEVLSMKKSWSNCFIISTCSLRLSKETCWYPL